MTMATDSKNRKASVKPIPDGYHTVTPFLICNQAYELMLFIEKAFGGKVNYKMDTQDGKVMHATMTIGDSIIMVSDASEHFGPNQTTLHLYVEDVDSVYQQAIKAKGESIREPVDEFYGDRSAGVKDPWGNQWWMATHIEDVDDEEMQRRAEAFEKQGAPA